MWQDIRFGLRTLVKNPGFTVVAIAALALGIGVNATVFSLANAILFKSLPLDGADRILYLTSTDTRTRRFGEGISYPDLRDFQSQLKSFSGLGASTRCQGNFSDSAAYPENYRCSQITSNTFGVIAQKPILGREFLADDERPGALPVAILTYGLWEKRYGKDPAVIGRTIRINSVPTTVVGVMPKGLEFPPSTEFWQPLIRTAAMQDRGQRSLNVFGRLAAGASLQSARAEVAGVSQNLARQYPDTNKETTVLVRRFNELALKSELRTLFMVLLGAVGFVLLIACANVANLLLARAVGRTREISIRIALGAGRWRIIRQLLAESLLLSIAGGSIGLLIAQWGTRAFDVAIAPTGKPTWIDFSPDYRAFAYLAAITLGSGILFGLAPALRLSRLDVNSSLKEGRHGAGSGMRGKYLSGLLVVAEMSLAVVLLAGAGLMIRSFLYAYNTPVGFDTSHILTLQVDPPAAKYPKAADQIALYQRITDQLSALPGVESATLTSMIPGNGFNTQQFEVAGSPPTDASLRPATGLFTVGAEYFSVIRVLPQAGRAFLPTDGIGGTPVAVVNRGFAQSYFKGEEAIGKRVRLLARGTPEPWLTIVGVVPDITQTDFSHTKSEPMLYQPFRQDPQRMMHIVARTRVAPGSLGDVFRRALQTVDPDLPAREVTTLDDRLALSNWPLQVFGSMFAIFAGIALLLASVGLYAVVAHMVSQRTHEIGVRVALGASQSTILRLVFTQGMLPMGIGLAIGLGAALGITRVLKALLVGVSPTDPLTLGTVAVVLILAATAGCAVPARRAIRTDPAIALRHE